ncbi:MAG TPA: gamma carbonic anhydrase family protein [Candidatus Cybelea sp.]|nr:gamma carbonic anhydrase family protein [Candidatus Cybelea sp.]
MSTILPFKGVMPAIAANAFVAPTATVIGNVDIGARSGVWFNCVLRGDVHTIHVGAGSNIQDGTVVHVSRGTHATWIGDNVTVGHMALIHGCRLEDGSFIGMSATVMDGCVVEGGAMVAAGALLTPGKRVPAGELWSGRPAKFTRMLSPEEIARFAGTAKHYAELAAEYRRALSAGRGLKAG